MKHCGTDCGNFVLKIFGEFVKFYGSSRALWADRLPLVLILFCFAVIHCSQFDVSHVIISQMWLYYVGWDIKLWPLHPILI